MQAFKLEAPAWLKYLQIHQLSHHGTEAVCALNDVCVYGKSAAEDLEDRLAQEVPADEDQHASSLVDDAMSIEDSAVLPDQAQVGLETVGSAEKEASNAVAVDLNATQEMSGSDGQGSDFEVRA